MPYAVNKGYDILNSQGILIQRVAPAQTNFAAQLNDASGQNQEDTFLLRSYSSVAEIEAARDRKLTELNLSISRLKQQNPEQVSSALAALQHKRNKCIARFSRYIQRYRKLSATAR